MPRPLTEPIHLTVAGRPDDPRTMPPPPAGVVIHYAPELHPEDVMFLDGIPVTSVARTLVDLAECCTREELVMAFQSAKDQGLLDMAAVERAYARVEWRPSLAMLRGVMDAFS